MKSSVRIYLTAACALLGAGPAAAWDCNNANRTPVTITAGASGHNEEIRVELASADFPAGYAFSAVGEDVRVFAADDTTPVDHIVTGWDSVARTAIIYVRPAALAASASTTLYIYYGDSGAVSVGDAPSVFPDVGLRLRSRVSTADPTDAASARTAFAAATTDVDDAVRATISGLNNRALGGTNGDYGWCVSAMLEVTAATAGVWDFRYGGDFGARRASLSARTGTGKKIGMMTCGGRTITPTHGETLEGSITLPVAGTGMKRLGSRAAATGRQVFRRVRRADRIRISVRRISACAPHAASSRPSLRAPKHLKHVPPRSTPAKASPSSLTALAMQTPTPCRAR